MTKKILIVTNKESNILSFRSELVLKTIENGYDLYIATPDTGQIEEIRKLGFKEIFTYKIDRHGVNLFSEFKLYKVLKKIIANLKPDLILTFTIKPNIYCGIAARKLKIPCIANITGLGGAVHGGGIKNKIFSKLYKYGIKKNVYTFVQNTEIEEFCIKNKIKNTILIPGSGVNLEKFNKKEYPVSQITKFLFVGRVMKDKGVNELKDAFLKLFETNQNVELRIIGEVEYDFENVFEGLEHKNIFYLGKQSNVIKYISEASCIVLPSYHEGMSNALLEGAACARPLICSNIAGCKETLVEGYNGYLCNVRDANSLYEQMLKFANLTNKEKEQMGKNSYDLVIEKFDRNIVINKYLEIIYKVIGGCK